MTPPKNDPQHCPRALKIWETQASIVPRLWMVALLEMEKWGRNRVSNLNT